MEALVILLALAGQPDISVCTSTPSVACEDQLTYALIGCQEALEATTSTDTIVSVPTMDADVQFAPRPDRGQTPTQDAVLEVHPWWLYLLGVAALGTATVTGFGLGRL